MFAHSHTFAQIIEFYFWNLFLDFFFELVNRTIPGMACWIFSSINSVGGVYHVLQFTCSRILSHQAHKSNVYERVLLQSG